MGTHGAKELHILVHTIIHTYIIHTCFRIFEVKFHIYRTQCSIVSHHIVHGYSYATYPITQPNADCDVLKVRTTAVIVSVTLWYVHSMGHIGTYTTVVYKHV